MSVTRETLVRFVQTQFPTRKEPLAAFGADAAGAGVGGHPYSSTPFTSGLVDVVREPLMLLMLKLSLLHLSPRLSLPCFHEEAFDDRFSDETVSSQPLSMDAARGYEHVFSRIADRLFSAVILLPIFRNCRMLRWLARQWQEV